MSTHSILNSCTQICRFNLKKKTTAKNSARFICSTSTAEQPEWELSDYAISYFMST